jgi:hypothetical protein
LARLQQQADAAAAERKAAVDAQQRQHGERVAFNSLLINGVLDEKHHSADALVAALSLLQRIVGNVLDNPSEAKYRQVKLASGAYTKTLLPLGTPVEKLLTACGWRTRTVQLEKAWVFDGKVGSADWARLVMAREVLSNAAEAMAAKAARKAREKEERLTRAAAESERLKLALADDQALRALDYEARRRTNPAVSEWQPGQQQKEEKKKRQRRGTVGSGEGEEEEDEEDEDEDDGGGDE